MTGPDRKASASRVANGIEHGHQDRGRRWLPLAGGVVGACAMLPPYVGPGLNTAHRVEVADHVVPGVVIVVVSAIVLAAARRRPLPGTPMLLAGLVVVLAGMWMASTHVPLLGQAARHEAPWGPTIYHCASAVLVLTFGLAWTKASWSDAEGGEKALTDDEMELD